MNNVALIVLNYNSGNDTVFCVKKIASFQKNYHIIVVDNCSTDDSLTAINNELKDTKNVDIVISKENKGYSAGNNLGIKYAVAHYKIDVIGILNPDVIIPNSDVIENIIFALESDSSYAVAAGVAITAANEFNINNSCWDIPSSRELVRDHFLLNHRKQKTRNLKLLGANFTETECVAGCFFFVKADYFKNLGYFDENVFLYNEENILGIKCKKAGYKEIVVLDQFYIHNHKYHKAQNISFKQKVNTTKKGFNSRLYLCKKYYKKSMIPRLYIVEGMNRIYLVGCYLANKVTHKN